MKPLKERFKKFGGEFIPDIVEYLRSYITSNPNVTISIGCDSVQKRRKTIYAVTIMLYNVDFKNGAHLVFFRQNIQKVRDNFDRLQKEVEILQEVAEFLQTELEPFYKRSDLTLMERRKYKFHLNKCNGDYSHLPNMNEYDFIKNLSLNDHETVQDFKLVDIHIDFNPFEGGSNSRGHATNRSYLSYKSFVPWLRGMGYRVWAKPLSFASTSAADLLLQN
jgi:predicted RNase H-related nuclease YkuK (DUF458 family)